MSIITLGLRGAQVVFAAIVLGLSVALVKGYGPGHAPSLLDYGAFCGGATFVVAIVGVATCFWDGIAGIIMLVLDGITCFFLLAGGIVRFSSFLQSKFSFTSRHATNIPTGLRRNPQSRFLRQQYLPRPQLQYRRTQQEEELRQRQRGHVPARFRQRYEEPVSHGAGRLHVHLVSVCASCCDDRAVIYRQGKTRRGYCLEGAVLRSSDV